MRTAVRIGPALLATSIVVLVFTSAFRADEAGNKGATRLDKQKVSAVVKTVIARGADLYNLRDFAGCYRFFQGSLTTLRPLLDRYPRTQKAIDASLAEAERSPSMSQRCWILYRSLGRVYTQLAPAADKKDKAGKKAGKKREKDSGKDRDKSKGKKEKKKQDQQDNDRNIPKDLLKDVKRVDKSGRE